MPEFTNEEIRFLRQSRNLKQEEVAKRLQISRQRYSKLENHRNLLQDRTIQIVIALGFSIDGARKLLDSIPPPHKKRSLNKY